MKNFFTSALMCLCTVACMNAKSVTFKAACYNVDGLPFFNTDGPQEDGTIAISQRIAQEGWDFFGVSEDFGYHDQLVSALSDYNIGKYRGTVTSKNSSAANRADTDGLCFFAKKISAWPTKPAYRGTRHGVHYSTAQMSASTRDTVSIR